MVPHFTRSGVAAALMVLSLSAVAQDLEAELGRPGSIVSTVPIAREDSVVTPSQGGRIDDLVAGRPAAAPAGATASAPRASPESLGFLMSTDQLPWPLRYRELTPPGALYLPLPDAASLRLMLPGHSLEEGRQARQGVAKFITNLIGVASQDRTRQLDAFVTWTEQTLKQKSTLTATDAWQQYVFWAQVHESAEAYRAGVLPQTDAVSRDLAEAIPKFVADVTALMNAAQGYEQRMTWYQVLTQLKEGLQLYQMQMQAGDEKILQAIANFLESNPAPARPDGPPPVYDVATGKRAMPKTVTAAPTTEIAAPQARREAAEVAAEPAAQGNPLVAYLLVGAVLAAVVAGVLRLRRRKSPQAPAA